MINLPRTQILMLRAQGYPLEGENWLQVEPPQLKAQNMRITRVIEGDTLAIVHIPADVFQQTSN